MPPTERGSLKKALSNLKRPDSDKDAELRLLGRTAEPQNVEEAAKAAQVILDRERQKAS